MVYNLMDFPSPTAADSLEITPSVIAGGFAFVERDTRLYIDTDSHERGSRGAFYPAYTDDSHTDRHGFFCGACQSAAVGMDTMGRLACSDCGNERKPTQWDAAYL